MSFSTPNTKIRRLETKDTQNAKTNTSWSGNVESLHHVLDIGVIVLIAVFKVVRREETMTAAGRTARFFRYKLGSKIIPRAKGVKEAQVLESFINEDAIRRVNFAWFRYVLRQIAAALTRWKHLNMDVRTTRDTLPCLEEVLPGYEVTVEYAMDMRMPRTRRTSYFDNKSATDDRVAPEFTLTKSAKGTQNMASLSY